ncbi:MAG: protein phosphatase 2C domain-containing protein [Patescibacteria group bacterium]
MKLSADHCFAIGRPHAMSGTPCEDYALSGADETSAYAVVSDGCSSAPHSDIASRIVAHALHHELVAGAFRESCTMLSGLQKRMRESETALGVAQNKLRATALGVFAHLDRAVINVFGDGVFAIKYRDGTLMMCRHDWEKNAPFYPAYFGGSLAEFRAFHADVQTPVRVQWATSKADSSGEYTERCITRTLSEGVLGFTFSFPQWRIIEKSGIEFIALMSDGVTQIDGMDWKEAVGTLLSFKTTAGSFVKRRMMHVVRESQKTGRGPLDDIACAVIHFEQEVENGETETS